MSESEQAKQAETTVIVNGRPKGVASKELTFQQVVALAYDGNPPSGPDYEFTITYRKGGEDGKKEGTLTTGQSVKVKDGMVFNVVTTNKS